LFGRWWNEEDFGGRWFFERGRGFRRADDAVGHEPGFSGARRGQYQERAIEMAEDGGLLSVGIAHCIGVIRVSERIEARGKDELNGIGDAWAESKLIRLRQGYGRTRTLRC